MVGEDMASSDFEGKEGDDKGKKKMKPKDEGILKLEWGFDDDDLDSLNGLLHWQMEDYELFPSCHMLGVEEGNKEDEKDEFLTEYREFKEGEASIEETPTHTFNEEKAINYEKPLVKTVSLGDEANHKSIFVGDDWNLVLKATTFKIFIDSKDVFTWAYKDLKGMLSELCPPDPTNTRNKFTNSN